MKNEIYTNDKIISDKYDLYAELIQVFARESLIPKDFVLFHSSEEDIEYFRNIYNLAKTIYGVIPDKKIAKEMYFKLIHELVLIAVMRRNRADNLLVKGFLNIDRQENIETEEKEGMLNKLLKKDEKGEKEKI